jgi:type I restriction-modification system DNA methylase subunit
MDRAQATHLVRDTFTQRFDDTRFLHFTRNLLNHLDESKKQTWTLKKDAFKDYVNHFARLGTYTDPRGERMDVLVIHLRKETTLARGRVTLRNFVADYLATGHGQGKAAVIAAFVSPTEEDWRFSFVKLDFTMEKTELGLVTEKALLTPARRYSYLVGKNEQCHTAQKQFLELLQTDSADPTVAQLEAAFKVEKVTKEFFEHYRELFEKTRDELKVFLKHQPAIEDHFQKLGIENDDFAKKLLGQIVFLYFLQKKGWFGVARGQDWGKGRKDFIRHLFTQRADFAHVVGKRRTPNFFNDILEPLFYEALAAPRLDDDHYYSRFDCRIPFLNGGLFEPLYGYNWVETEILLPDTLFSNDELSNEGDVGTGILDVFDRYNFTVNEAEPLEVEVAVDPEMLGKVFENLLPENIRHRSGTYYTPRVIVHYMCQQALLHYLAARASNIPQDDLSLFLRLAERYADFEAKETKAHADKRLPEAISQNAALIDDLLAAVTVCDPAIGSGAFPVGMMHEIVRARMALTPVLEKDERRSPSPAGAGAGGRRPGEGRGAQSQTHGPDVVNDRSAYTLKRHAIHHSLYGVDLDPGAVEIAKLRLWLSMVVDEDELHDIQPLPNLDYKIMQGNSLLEEFEGVRLFDERILAQTEEPPTNPRIAELEERQRWVAREVNRLAAANQLSRAMAKHLKDEGARLSKELHALKNPSAKKSGDHPELSLGPREILKRIQQLQDAFFDENSRMEKKHLREELSALEWEFMRATLREQGREEALEDLEKACATHRKPFFLWWLHFSEIKKKLGGFDVVLANPPFVRMELIMEEKPALKRRFKHLFSGRADLYVYFYGLAIDILHDNGCLAFISSNTYLNAKFGIGLREHFLAHSAISTLIDFAETHVFDAVVEPAIIVLRKVKGSNASVCCVKWQEDQSLDELPEVVAHKAQIIPQNTFSGEPWRLVAGAESRIFAVLNRGTKLAELAEDGILYGVKTGLNAAFIIGDAKRRELCEDERSCDIIKPFIRGRDIGRWAVRPTEAWLIYTYHGVDIKRYPLIEKHLRPHKEALEARATQQAWYELQQPQFRYSKLFGKPKIVYQDISRTYAFAYDRDGCFCGDTTFVLPTPHLALVGVLQSNAIKWWAHTDQGVPFGGFLRLKAQYMSRCPIPGMTDPQQEIIMRLVEYMLWLNREVLVHVDETNSTLVQPLAAVPANAAGGTLLAGYLEQWINALVYELFFPEQLHAAGLHFFRLAEEARLPALSALKGKELATLQALFEKLYRPDHPLRQGLFALDSIEEIRIIEGKA